jgi:GrpB-like predicted nucleotidyltransferase (UPF0157 family)
MRTHRLYELQEYNPEWKETFLDAAKIISKIMGEDALQIEHVGSTSVEGMVAKPQVDILVVVKELDVVLKYYDAFREVGFTIHGRGYVRPDIEYISKDSQDGTRLISIHIVAEENPKIFEFINFREYLKVNKEEREKYIQLKRNLFSSHPNNYGEYISGKNEAIEEIKARAKKWAGENKI